MRPYRPQTLLRFTLTAVVLGLGACSDGTDNGEGGGAGDADPVAVARIEPFEGLYDLGRDWREIDGDEAVLSIGAPNDAGVAPVRVFELDEDIGNCYRRDAVGTIRLDDFTNSVFLDDILSFMNGIVTLDGFGDLIVMHEDFEDLDGDGNRTEQVTLQAPPIGGVEADLPRC